MGPIHGSPATSSASGGPSVADPNSLLSKKEQNRIAQSNYRQRQKTVSRINQQEMARLATVASAANAEAAAAQAQAAHARAEVQQLMALVTMLKAKQEEADRVASLVAAEKVKAAEAQAAAAAALMEHLEAMAAFRVQQEELTKEAQAQALLSHTEAEEAHAEAAKARREVEYLRALLGALDAEQKRSQRSNGLAPGTSRLVSLTGQDMMQRAGNQEREIMVAFDALNAKLGSIRKKCDSVPANQEIEVEGLAMEKMMAMRECALQIYSDVLAPVQNDRNRLCSSSGSMDATDSELLQGPLPAAPLALGQWRGCVPSPFATASPPSRSPAGIATEHPLDESGSDPLITLCSIANDSLHLLTGDIYGTLQG